MSKQYKDASWLEQKYVVEGLNGYEIAEICDITNTTVYSHLDKYEIEREEPLYKDQEWLRNKYLSEEKTTREIAEICNVSGVTISNWLKEFSIKTGVSPKSCYKCGDVYRNMGNHWSNSSCGFPELTEHQKEVFTGLLMGDGYVMHGSRMPIFQLSMITEPFLKYLTEEVFPVIGSDVSLRLTSEESKKSAVKSGLFPVGSDYECQEVYSWHTTSHPQLEEFSNWYSSGEKVWPYEQIELTPTVLKYLYVCDGTCKFSSGSPYVSIGMSNEHQRQDSIRSIFEEIGVEPRFELNTYEDGSVWMNVSFSVEDSKYLLDYMGEPLPGFEYKWRKENE